MRQKKITEDVLSGVFHSIPDRRGLTADHIHGFLASSDPQITEKDVRMSIHRAVREQKLVAKPQGRYIWWKDGGDCNREPPKCDKQQPKPSCEQKKKQEQEPDCNQKQNPEPSPCDKPKPKPKKACNKPKPKPKKACDKAKPKKAKPKNSCGNKKSKPKNSCGQSKRQSLSCMGAKKLVKFCAKCKKRDKSESCKGKKGGKKLVEFCASKKRKSKRKCGRK